MKRWLLFTTASNSLQFLPPDTKLHNTLASEQPVRFSDVFERQFEIGEKAVTFTLPHHRSRLSDLLVLLYSPKNISRLEQTFNKQKMDVVLY